MRAGTSRIAGHVCSCTADPNRYFFCGERDHVRTSASSGVYYVDDATNVLGLLH